MHASPAVRALLLQSEAGLWCGAALPTPCRCHRTGVSAAGLSEATTLIVLPAPWPTDCITHRVVIVGEALALGRSRPRHAIVLNPECTARAILPSPHLACLCLHTVHGCWRALAGWRVRPCQSGFVGLARQLHACAAEGAAAIILPAPQSACSIVHTVTGGRLIQAGRRIAPGDEDWGAEQCLERAALAVLPAPQSAFRICKARTTVIRLHTQRLGCITSSTWRLPPYWNSPTNKTLPPCIPLAD